MSMSLHRGPDREPGGGSSFTWDFERQVQEGSGEGAAVSVGL
jgi:hypothetical protein